MKTSRILFLALVVAAVASACATTDQPVPTVLVSALEAEAAKAVVEPTTSMEIRDASCRETVEILRSMVGGKISGYLVDRRVTASVNNASTMEALRGVCKACDYACMKSEDGGIVIMQADATTHSDC